MVSSTPSGFEPEQTRQGAPCAQWSIQISWHFLRSLLVGPYLLQNLIFVLLRFRQHKYAVSADIEGMFLQVGVLARDQPSLRFLWREDPTSSVVVHQYTRHIFGARDSPTCANCALQKTASDNQAEYPKPLQPLSRSFTWTTILTRSKIPLTLLA